MSKIKHSTKKAQAAMEFLMTYGWAIITILIAVGAIAYFGVLEPQKFLPRKCIIQPGIYCKDFKVNEDAVTLLLQNAHGKTMAITSIQVEHCTGTISGSLQSDQQAQFIIDGCSNQANEKFVGEINITYSLAGGLSRIKKGSLLTAVENGNAAPSGSYYWITTTQIDFDEGSYTQTQSTASGTVELTSGQNTGTYASKIFDAGRNATWNNISWGEPIAYKEHVEPDGTDCSDSTLKGAWALEESSGTVVDSSYCNKNGNNVDATSTNGKIDKAYEFDTSNYVGLNQGWNQGIFSEVPEQFTVMAWIYPYAYGMHAFYHGWKGEFWLGIGGDGKLTLGLKQTKENCGNWNGEWHNLATSQVYSTGNWYHLTGVYDKSENKMQIYVNGTLVNQSLDKELNATECLSPSNPSSSHPPTIAGASGSPTFNGIIDEVVLYSTELSPQEILNNYKQGILDLNLRVRSCNDPNCNGESFSETFTNASTQPLNIPVNRYLQYQVTFNSEDASHTPILEDITVGYTIS